MIRVIRELFALIFSSISIICLNLSDLCAPKITNNLSKQTWNNILATSKELLCKECPYKTGEKLNANK